MKARARMSIIFALFAAGTYLLRNGEGDLEILTGVALLLLGGELLDTEDLYGK